MKKTEDSPATSPAATYSKEQLLASKRFTPLQKDVLTATLKDGEQYTIQQANKQIEDFGKRRVDN